MSNDIVQVKLLNVKGSNIDLANTLRLDVSVFGYR